MDTTTEPSVKKATNQEESSGLTLWTAAKWGGGKAGFREEDRKGGSKKGWTSGSRVSKIQNLSPI